MKYHKLIFIFTVINCTLVLVSNSQVLTENPPSNNQTTQNNSTTVINQEPKRSDKPFLGTDVPIFNPGTEVFSWDGQNWNINNNRLMRARFEKYLNTPADNSEDDKEYRNVLKKILDSLSPHKRGNNHLQDAVSLLPRASNYRIDSNLCDSLSQAILGVYYGQKNAVALAEQNAALNKERKLLNWNVEVATSESLIDEARRRNAKSENSNKQQNQGKAVSNTGRVAGYIQRLAEIEALRIANKTKIGISEVQAKIEYQALILQFAVQRRWEHVLIATRIYRRLFRDGDGVIEIKKDSDADKMLAKGLGLTPTVTSLDMFANEVLREVDEAVVAFEFLADKNELETASKRLAEAFFIGEYLPRIRTLDREKKMKVQSFVRDADSLLSAMDVRDYKNANEIIERMRVQALDFNYSKAKAGIEFYTNMSNTSIAQAKIAAQKGNTDEYKKQMQMAIEAWPLNPQIKEQNDLFASIADVQVTTLNELDTLLAQGNKREIMKNRGRFIAAVQNDQKRTQQLESILNDVLLLEQEIAIIKGLNDNDNPWGAWEIARNAQEKFSDDNELLKLSVELGEKVSPFVRVIKRAEKLEDEKHNGMSLTWYLKAKSIYPKSNYAKDGMNRLLNIILPADIEENNDEAAIENQPEKLEF
ncbi:MAG: hypothetical protein VYC05_05650 [Verrucomicrobiota bacterium]|nr:hypothetical protein [Verrucomicrobiales bacterium]MBB26205.1 hypothetical protein [Verrucomicrobiaceae bacterium]MEE2724845.1 hypothetical protein [Verrucomicrobiota bacterium]